MRKPSRGRMRPRVRPPAMAALLWRVIESSASGSHPDLIPFGRLRGLLLSRQYLCGGDRPILLLRELEPALDRRQARCVWSASTSTVVAELTRPLFDLGDPLSLKPWQGQLASAAQQLAHALDQAAAADLPPLPPTVLVLPPHADIRPRPTRAIIEIAQARNQPWEDVWHELARERQIETAGDGLVRIDGRLCDRITPGRTWPGALALEHDLRGLPTTPQVWRLPLGGAVPESLHVCLPHACLDGWQAPPQAMRLLNLETFAAPFAPRIVSGDESPDQPDTGIAALPGGPRLCLAG